jgi:hypothetical protein
VIPRERLEEHPTQGSATRGGPPLWTVLLVLATVTSLYWYRLGTWPWDHDEVLSQAEVGVVAPDTFPGPRDQVEKLARLLPVGALIQSSALRVLPHDELGARLVPTACGVAVVVWSFVLGWRWRGSLFAWSLLAMVGGSQLMIWLSKQNRFYPIALLGLLATTVQVLSPSRSPVRAVFGALLAALTMLTHALALVPLGLMAIASAAMAILARGSRTVLVRSWVVALAALLVYVTHSRPIIAGWISGTTGGTSPLVSLLAQVGIPTLAFALFGACAVISGARAENSARWWTIVAVLSLLFAAAVPLLIRNWNPRYALFLAPPLWVVAALGVETVLRGLPSSGLQVALLLTVLTLQAPKLASHLLDGSRHDFRSAAAIIAQANSAGLPVYSNWPATLQYYMSSARPRQVADWPPPDAVNRYPCFVALGTNLWQPALAVPGARVTVLAEVRTRRLDEQSHVVRVYRVDPVEARRAGDEATGPDR